MNVSTPEFWILVSFILLLCGLGKRVYVMIAQALDRHTQAVATQLKEASHLQDEAASLLATYKAKHKSAMKEIQALQISAEKEVEDFKKTAETAYRKFKKEREKLMEDNIDVIQKEFLTKLRSEIVEEALSLVEKTLLKDEKMRKSLTLATLQSLKSPSKTLNRPSRKKKRDSRAV